MRKLLLALLLIPSLAFGQAVTVKVDTIFTALTVTIPQTITLQLVNGGVAIAGQSVTLTPSAPGWLFLNATFPSQPVQQTVTGVRVIFTLPPGNGWSQDAPWPLTAPLAVTVPAGNTLTVAYNPLLGTLTATPNAPAVAPPPPPPPVLTWTTIATQHQGFTLSVSGAVRYGEVATNRFNTKTLAAGSYTCDNVLFGDPAPGVDAKVCQVQK